MNIDNEVSEQQSKKGFEHLPEDCLDYIDDPSHARSGIHTLHNKLYVVTVLFDPLRFRSRYFNYWTFASMCEKAGVILYTAEISFGEREFEITDANNPKHLQLRAKDNQELWLKENALNLLIERLPSDWKYVAWLDSDISFTRPDWGQETLHLLQHYDFIQMLSHCQDIGVNYEPAVLTPGFVYGKKMEEYELHNPDSGNGKGKGTEKRIETPLQQITRRLGLNKCMEECLEEAYEDCEEECHYYYGAVKMEKGGVPIWKFRHPGFCWATRRSALDKVGGLIDWAILGSSDLLMAMALYGEVDKMLKPNYSDNYLKLTYIWQERALKHIRKNVGYLPGTVVHYYHGAKKDRRYDDRWRLLVDTKFDPITDLKRDSQGLYQLQDDSTDRFIQLRDGLRRYARLRNEDSNVGTIVP